MAGEEVAITWEEGSLLGRRAHCWGGGSIAGEEGPLLGRRNPRLCKCACVHRLSGHASSWSVL